MTYLNNVREKSLTKDKKWIENFIQKDRIGFGNLKSDRLDTKIRKNKYVKIIHSMMDGLEELYPGDWDIFIQIVKARYSNYYYFSLTPVILFRNITISNSVKLEHNIKNLFVFIPIKSNLKIGIIEGTRSSISEKEFISGYIHSHLIREDFTYKYNKPFNPTPFCLGESEMLDLKTEMLSNKVFDMDLFRLYIMCLKTFVSWESIEGVPYNYIKNIISNSNESINDSEFINISIVNFVEYYEYIKEELFKNFSKFEIIIQEGEFNVKIDESFKNCVTNCLLKKDLWRVLGHRVGIMWKYKKTSNAIKFDSKYIKIDDKIPYIIFGGEKMNMEVYADEEEEIEIRYAHPEFLKYVKEQIKKFIYEKQIRSYSIKRLFEINNA